MRITRLEVTDFRSYDRFEVEPDPALTVFVGPNAAGKTNLMEALRLLTATTALRPCKWDELVRTGADQALALLEAREGERRLEIRMDVSAEGRRAWRVNGQSRRGAAQVAGLLPSVAFTPDDLDLMKGPAERRRAAVDDLGGQLSAVYAALKRDHGRVIRQRNALLKEQASDAELAAWDEQAARLGGSLLVHRLRLAGRVMEAAQDRYAQLADDETLGWTYQDRSGLAALGAGEVGDITEQDAARAIAEETARRRGEERRRGMSLVGPHRDDLVIQIEGRGARSFASQGQQRTAALAWKLAEVAVIEEVVRRRPVLLLDDVMSELDGTRRDALARQVSEETQTFVTTTNLGYFSEALLKKATIVELKR